MQQPSNNLSQSALKLISTPLAEVADAHGATGYITGSRGADAHGAPLVVSRARVAATWALSLEHVRGLHGRAREGVSGVSDSDSELRGMRRSATAVWRGGGKAACFPLGESCRSIAGL